MSKWYIGFIFVSVGIIIGSYQNCAAKRSFSEAVYKSIDGSNVTEGTIDDVKYNCDLAESKGLLVETTQTINFDDTKVESGRANVCQFNVDGNGAMTNSKLMARYEQKRDVVLPAKAVICDVEMKTAVQKFRYDDVFFLTYNNQLLATNAKNTITSRLTPKKQYALEGATGVVPVFEYDWSLIKTAYFTNVVDDYCMGKEQGLASCSWPITQATGNISFDFDQKLLIAIGLASKNSKQQFNFIMTGDNDPSEDCYHEKLDFKVQVHYYVAP